MKNIFKTLSVLATMTYLAACSSPPSGEKVVSGEAKLIDSTAAPTAKVLNVDIAASQIAWVGNKTGGQHSGTINIKSGSLKVNGNKIVGGSFVIDMTSIAATDLQGKSKADLEGHLKTADFFEADKHPEGKFEIAEVKDLPNASDLNSEVVGNLTLKGITKSISFHAKVSANDAGVSAEAPQFTINRQDWGINYKSTAKDVVINDQMGIKIKLVAK